MNTAYWQKQDKDQPLFQNLIWSRPEQKSAAGKLLIIGGNIHGIAAPAEAYDYAINQGAGECKVVLPAATKKLLPISSPEIVFAASNKSGSFATDAFAELPAYNEWADATLFAGDFGNNSETTLLVEKLTGLKGLQLYAGDSIELIYGLGQALLHRPNTTILLRLNQLQKLVTAANYPRPITSTMSLLQIVEFLHDFSSIFSCNIMLKFQNYMVIASGGHIVSTLLEDWPKEWNIKHSAAAVVWWLQNPQKPLQAISTAITQI